MGLANELGPFIESVEARLSYGYFLESAGVQWRVELRRHVGHLQGCCHGCATSCERPGGLLSRTRLVCSARGPCEEV